MTAHVVRIGDLLVDIGDATTARARALVAERDRVLGKIPDQGQASATHPVMIARVGSLAIAFPLDTIAGVIAAPRAHRLPGAPAHHLGLFVHEGATANLLAIDGVLGLDRASGEAALLLAGAGPLIALAVDAAVGLGQASAPIDDDRVALAPIAAAEGADLPLVNVPRLLAALGQVSGDKEFDA